MGRFGVPQWLVWGSLLCSIYMGDLFPFVSESNIANYTDYIILLSTNVKRIWLKSIQWNRKWIIEK